MKFAASIVGASIVGGVLLAQSVSTFVPSADVPRRTFRLFAASNDVPDIVNAYRRVKPTQDFKDLSISTPKVVDPVRVVPDTQTITAVPDVVTVKVHGVTSSVPSVPDVVPDVTVKVHGVTSSVPSVPDVPAPEAVSGGTAIKMNFVDEFLQSAKQGYHGSVDHLPRSLPHAPNDVPTLAQWMKDKDYVLHKSAVTETSAVTGGKTPTLGEYFAQRVAGGLEGHVYDETQSNALTNAKEKIGLLFSNTYGLFGGKGSASSALPHIPSLNELPEGAAGWSVAAFALVLAAGQRNAGVSDVRSEMESMVEKEAMAVSELAEHVKCMGEEIKTLHKQTGDLRKDLQAAKDKLTQKELEISQQRLKVVDKEVEANRRVEKLDTRLRQSDDKIRSMELELKETRDVRDQLAKALQKVKDMEGELKSAGSEKMVEEIKEAFEPSRVNGAAAEVVPDKKTTVEAKGAANKEKATKGEKAAVKKIRVTKVSETVTAKAKTVEIKTASQPKMAATKKEGVEERASASKEWSGLSQSTLSRKTIKELKEYLVTKGVATSGGDGKPFKKALLVDAVLSL